MPKRYVILLGQVCDYEEKAPFVVSGKSVLGAMEYDRTADKLKCHECGEWFGCVSKHAVHKHGISSKEYKEKHRLRIGSALVAPGVAASIREKLIANLSSRTGSLKASARKGGFTKGDKRPIRRGVYSGSMMEWRNVHSTCPAQLVERVKAIAKDLGRAPKGSELQTAGIHLRRKMGMTVNEALDLAGLKTNPYRKEQYAGERGRQILIELLRDFYVRNRRAPNCRDWASGLLPNRKTYTFWFGSVFGALDAAGLSGAYRGLGGNSPPAMHPEEVLAGFASGVASERLHLSA